MAEKCFQHLNPVWRDRTNYILGIRINDTDKDGNQLWEQVWTERISQNIFVLCCIPVIAYGYSLGDQVESRDAHWITGVIRPSSFDTIRIWFEEDDLTMQNRVIDRLLDMGCLFEWYSKRLLGVAVPREFGCEGVIDKLRKEWSEEEFEVEIGSSHEK